jgi:hypothetical protein
MPCAGNLTEEKFCVTMSEFPTGIWIPEVCWKENLVTLCDVDITMWVCEAPSFPYQVEYRKSHEHRNTNLHLLWCSTAIENYGVIVDRRFGGPIDTESYAGGSVKLLLGLPIPHRSKGKGQTKYVYSPCSCRLDVVRGAITPPRKNLLLRNWHSAVAPVKKG